MSRDVKRLVDCRLLLRPMCATLPTAEARAQSIQYGAPGCPLPSYTCAILISVLVLPVFDVYLPMTTKRHSVALLADPAWRVTLCCLQECRKVIVTGTWYAFALYRRRTSAIAGSQRPPRKWLNRIRAQPLRLLAYARLDSQANKKLQATQFQCVLMKSGCTSYLSDDGTLG